VDSVLEVLDQAHEAECRKEVAYSCMWWAGDGHTEGSEEAHREAAEQRPLAPEIERLVLRAAMVRQHEHISGC